MTAAATTAPVHRFEAAGLGTAPFTLEGMQVSKYQACQGAPIQPGSSCDYCGQGIMLVFMLRGADGRRFKVGCDCVLRSGDAGLMNAVKARRQQHTRELSAARAERTRQAKRRTREQAARLRRRQAWQRANAFAQAHGLIPALRVALRGSKRALAADLLRKLRTLGELSPAQTRLLQQLGTRLTPAPTGRVTFTAVIDSVKAREGVRGWVYKMTVTADGGFRAWMTAPTALLMAPGEGLERFRGMRVSVTATLEPSTDDPGFAFGKRPRVAVLEPAAPVTG